MDETIGRLLAVGNVAEVFEWGRCVVKLYKFHPMNLLGEVSQPVDACCRAADMPRQAVLSWLPYVAAARLAEDVPGELDDLVKIVDVLARPSPHPITVSPRANALAIHVARVDWNETQTAT